MLPASGGNLSGGCNSAGSSSYDLTSSGILLEHNFFKIHFIGWSPNVQVHYLEQATPHTKSCLHSLVQIWQNCKQMQLYDPPTLRHQIWGRKSTSSLPPCHYVRYSKNSISNHHADRCGIGQSQLCSSGRGS